MCDITFQTGQDVFFVANASSVNLTPIVHENGNNGPTESMNWKRLVVLVIIVHVYLLIGGLVFRELESHSEVQTRSGIINVTAEFLGEYNLQYWSIVCPYNSHVVLIIGVLHAPSLIF